MEIFEPRIDAEEDLYSYQPANNGADPFWCYGNTCIAETCGKVFASGLETLPNVKPLCNCVPRLYVRENDEWRVIYRGEGRTREPSPIGVFDDGRVFLTLNTTMSAPDEYSGPAKPSIMVFDANNPDAPGTEIFPEWDGNPEFTEHSYRSFAVDSENHELIALQNIGYIHAEYAFYDSNDKWSAAGKLYWPWGAEYDTPQPVRICYPNVQLKDKSVFICGVSDVVEPYDEWKDFKKELTGKEWDYDFRRLFFTWTDDITTGKFHTWMEISSRDKTAGWIFPCDMLVDEDDTVHILWVERAIDERLREKFFPSEKQSNSLNYAQIRNGVIRLRKAIYVGGEGEAPGLSDGGRFHRTSDGALVIVYHLNGDACGGNPQLRVQEISEDGRLGPHSVIHLGEVFSRFFSNTIRGGSQASDAIHMLGAMSGRVKYVKASLI